MKKSTIFLTLFLLTLGGAYVYFFTGMFDKPKIDIYPTSRADRKSSLNPEVSVTSFAMNGKHGLTSVKVYEAEDLKTNKYPRVFWHMVSDSNSVPVNSFTYGIPIKGMRMEPVKTRPRALEANKVYTLIIEAGKAKGKLDFQAKPAIDR